MNVSVTILVCMALLAAAVLTVRRREPCEPFAVPLPSWKPYVVEIPGVLTTAQCDALVAAAVAKGLTPSEVGGAEDGRPDPLVRTSTQAWFTEREHPVTDALRAKAAELMKGKFTFESVQVARYDPGGKYDTHYDGEDCGMGLAACPPDQRLATLLVYLSEPGSGGATSFPMLGTSVTPRKGSAVFFMVADPMTRELYEKTIHSGEPVTSGTKWIANVWARAG